MHLRPSVAFQVYNVEFVVGKTIMKMTARLGFIKRLGFKSETLPYLVEVSTLMGERKIETDKGCRIVR